MRQRVIQILYHALPIAAYLLHQRPGIIGAAILLVVVPYIKVRKLRAQLADAEHSGNQLRSEDLRKLVARWEYLTIKRIQSA